VKVKKLLWRLVSIKFSILPPAKTEIVIFDCDANNHIRNYLINSKSQCIDTRLNKINLLIFLISLKSLKSIRLREVFSNYLKCYIAYTNPKIVITYNDTLRLFYQIKHWYPNIFTMAIQRANRTEGIFDEVFKNNMFDKPPKCDLIAVFGSETGRIYQNYIDSKIICIGSLLNNSLYKINKKINKKKILFISDYRPFRSDTHPHQKHMIKVVSWLYRYIKKADLDLSICGAFKSNPSLEKAFFKNILGGTEWGFIPGSEKDAYTHINNSYIIVFVRSTLGFEAIAQGKRTAAFLGVEYPWLRRIPNKGPFWTKYICHDEFIRVMDYIVDVEDVRWVDDSKDVFSSIMNFDVDNLIIKKEIRKQLQYINAISEK